MTPDEEAFLINTLYNARADPSVTALQKLALSHREKLRDRLEVCSPLEFPEVQGEARAWKKILKYLTVKPLNQLEK